MLPDQSEHDKFRELLLENQKLLTENNQLLKKLHRQSVWGFWLRIFSFLIFIGVPFILYYYVIEPYFSAISASFQTFQQGLQDVPGWKQFYSAVKGYDTGE